jgi:hypothetical protein
MSTYEEYLRQAQYCQSMAQRSNSLHARAAWLRLADKWAALAAEKKHPQDTETSSATERKDRGYKDSSSTD